MLRRNEEVLFSLLKEEVEEEWGLWEGSKEQNSSVNLKIATKLKTMFKMYEKNKAVFEDSYFTFKGFVKKK